MPKYSVEVTITAQCSYTVEIETDGDPEEAAINLWREKTAEDFQVEKGYITGWEAEAEQLTWACEECSAEISSEQSNATGGLCTACNNAFQKEYGDG